MDTMLIILYILSMAIMCCFFFSEREITHSWRRRDAAYQERERIARNVVMETYKRLFHSEDYITKRETLVNLLDLLNVYGLSSCKDALEKPQDIDKEDAVSDCHEI
jgi:hypothetical protein